MPKSESAVTQKRKSQYKRNHYTQQWAEGKLNKSKSKSERNQSGEQRPPQIAGDDGSLLVQDAETPLVPLVFSKTIRAPGVLVNCVRGKEKKCGQELLAIFNSVRQATLCVALPS